jgi:hypothetical protein
VSGRPQRRARGGPAPSWRSDPSLSSRPPFEPGNLAALRHGATTTRLVAPIAEQYREALPRVAPWTERPAFDGAVASLAWIEAQLALVRHYLDEVGPLDEDGKPRPATALADRLEARAGTLRGELGLTPQSLAKLLASLASVAATARAEDAVEALKAEGRAIVQAREVADPDPETAA